MTNDRYHNDKRKAYKKRRQREKRTMERRAQRRAKRQIVRLEEGVEENDGMAATQGSTVEELEASKLPHNPSSDTNSHNPSLGSTSSSIPQKDLEELIIDIKKDPYLKHIIEDIEVGGPVVMTRYLNDPEAFQKLAQAMGFGDLGDTVLAPNAGAEVQTAKQAEPIVHRTDHR
ncbi:hypothetical protein MKW94_015494 [Papaver nudicaule]|uniref:Uncharacterized protein n=1 Tax=Papaver nudicaule TaxID=74823 RepID=A0AA41V4L9_PAPNU|nr:hypothetical protein [Papaver nudicaule]